MEQMDNRKGGNKEKIKGNRVKSILERRWRNRKHRRQNTNRKVEGRRKMKKNHTKQSLKMSALTLVLCIAMLIGTTFAWFTDSVTNKGNVIQSGNLSIDAMAYGIGTGGMTVEIPNVNGNHKFTFAKNGQNLKENTAPIINDKVFEPGKSNAKLLKVSNSGSLAAKINLDFQVTDGGLQEGSWFDFVKVAEDGSVTGEFQKRPMSQLQDFTGKVEVSLKAKENVQFVLVYGMYEEAGNDYQGKSFSANVSVLAKQDTVEEDGFGNNKYDSNASYPVANGAEFEEAMKDAADGDVIQLTSDVQLTSDLTIDKDLTIEGLGNAIISDKPVYIGAANDVVINNVEFTQPTNKGNNATSLYAHDFSGNLTLKNCRFVEFQWEGVQITPKADAKIVIDNCYFSNSKTMKESGITTNRYLHIEVTDKKSDISKINLQITNNTFNNVVQSAAGGDGYFKDSAVTSYGIPLTNVKCEGNTFTGKVQEDALTSSSVIWIANGFNAADLSYAGFAIKK